MVLPNSLSRRADPNSPLISTASIMTITILSVKLTILSCSLPRKEKLGDLCIVTSLFALVLSFVIVDANINWK